MLNRPDGMLSRNNKPPDIWDTHGISGHVFVNAQASSSSPYPGGFNPWISNVTEDTSPHVTSERLNPDTTLDPRCQSGPSARNSFDPEEWRFSKDYDADQQRLQISDLHFDKFPTPTTFACWKIRFKTEVCTCSQFPTDAMLWIKEVEMVESADDLESSRSIRGTPGPNFELLDARNTSALNKIIQHTRFEKKVSLEEMKAHKEDRFLRGRQIAHQIYDYFRVTGTNDSVENYAELFTVVLRNYDIQEFDSKWDEILLTMTQTNPTWWHLGKLVQIKNTRVWETQDRIGIVWPGDSSEEVGTWLSQIENTMSPRSTTLPLYFWYWGSSSEFLRWQRSINDATWIFLPLFCASSISSFSHSFSTAAFVSGIFNAWVREVTEQNVRTRQSTRRRGRRTTRHHNAAQLSPARVGALRRVPYCLGIGRTRVGPGKTPTVHPCWLRSGGRGWLNLTSTRTRHRSQTQAVNKGGDQTAW